MVDGNHIRSQSAVFLSVAVAAMGAGALEASGAFAAQKPGHSPVADIAGAAPYCDYPNSYYPAMCEGKQNATNNCSQEAAYSIAKLAISPADSEKNRFKESFNASTMGICGFAGERHFTMGLEERTRKGTFVPVGRQTHVTYDGNRWVPQNAPASQRSEWHPFTKTIDVPGTKNICAKKGGSLTVRGSVKISWTPNAGWGKTPQTVTGTRTPIQWEHDTKPVKVC